MFMKFLVKSFTQPYSISTNADKSLVHVPITSSTGCPASTCTWCQGNTMASRSVTATNQSHLKIQMKPLLKTISDLLLKTCFRRMSVSNYRRCELKTRKHKNEQEKPRLKKPFRNANANWRMLGRSWVISYVIKRRDGAHCSIFKVPWQGLKMQCLMFRE